MKLGPTGASAGDEENERVEWRRVEGRWWAVRGRKVGRDEEEFWSVRARGKVFEMRTGSWRGVVHSTRVVGEVLRIC